MAAKKKVLIFTYYWPPAGGVAVQRFFKFSKFLPEFGWEPIIITVENGSYPYYDHSLLKEVAPNLQVYRTKTFEPFELYNLVRGKKGKAIQAATIIANRDKSLFQRITEYIRANFFVPDARKGWVPYAVKQAEAIMKEQKIDAIITTGPPHSIHLAGLRLKQKYGVKWIADLRDPWTRIFYNEFLPRTEATKRKDAELEQQVLQTADKVVVISPGMKKQFTRHTDNIEVIYNGYDAEDFFDDGNEKPANVFTIRYLGNLMSNQNVVPFWNALAALKSRGANFKVELIGRVDAIARESITKAGLDDVVSYVEFVAHRQAMQLTRQASLLLFIVQNVEDKNLFLNTKLFEYIASGSEIISYGPVGGDADVVLHTVERKPIIDYGDEETTVKQLTAAYDYWQKTGTNFKYSNNLHTIFARKEQTAALAKVLDEL